MLKVDTPPNLYRDHNISDKSRREMPKSYTCQQIARNFYHWLSVTDYDTNQSECQDWYSRMEQCQRGKFT